MKQKFKNIIKLFALGTVLVLGGCATEEEFVVENAPRKAETKKITLEEFKQQTGLNNFQSSISIPAKSGDLHAKTADGSYELTDFEIETAQIIQHISTNNKTTYSFIVEPKDEILLEKENYNLVYNKVNNVWEQTIIYFEVEKIGNSEVFNNTETVYDSKMRPLCFGMTISVHCTNTGNCANSGTCDACDQCITKTYHEIPCAGTGGNDDGPPDHSNDGDNTNGPAGGGDFAFSPNTNDVPVANGRKPCESLKKLLKEDPAEPQKEAAIKPSLENLKAIAVTNANIEYGYEFSKNNMGNHSTSNLKESTTTQNELPVQTGGDVYAGVHTHFVDLIPMFSFGDVYTAFGLYKNALPENKQDATNMLVAKECITCTQVNVYAIKVTDYIKFRNRIQTDLNNLDTGHLSEKGKVDFANEKFLKKFNSNMTQMELEKVFLTNFNDCGIELYKANDNLNNWSKIKLSNDPIQPVISIPCN